MSSLQAALKRAGVAVAAPAPETQPDLSRFEKKPVHVQEREKLWDSGIVKLKIPDNARPMEAETAGGNIPYLQFGKKVAGGYINCHVRGDNPARFTGQEITARLEIWRKNSTDGRAFLYLDLYPIDGAERTHRLRIENDTGIKWPAHVKQFKTTGRIDGIILLCEVGKEFDR